MMLDGFSWAICFSFTPNIGELDVALLIDHEMVLLTLADAFFNSRNLSVLYKTVLMVGMQQIRSI
jgi:hypothetical protein